MLYLGIDLHRAQMTISLRNPNGDVLLRRQVSTRWPKLEEFRGQLRLAVAGEEQYVAVMEVRGFHDWLVEWLQEDSACHLVLVVQPLGRSATKTDRRDAHALGAQRRFDGCPIRSLPFHQPVAGGASRPQSLLDS